MLNQQDIDSVVDGNSPYNFWRNKITDAINLYFTEDGAFRQDQDFTNSGINVEKFYIMRHDTQIDYSLIDLSFLINTPSFVEHELPRGDFNAVTRQEFSALNTPMNVRPQRFAADYPSIISNNIFAPEVLPYEYKAMCDASTRGTDLGRYYWYHINRK